MLGLRVLDRLAEAGDPVVDRRDLDAADGGDGPVSVIIAATTPAR